MPKRNRSEAFVENDDFCNPSKRSSYRNPAIPFQKVKSQSFDSYRHLIENSTPKFRKKHVITETKNRKRLKEMCQKFLDNKKYNGTESKVHASHETIDSDLSRAVSDSCQSLAKKKIKIINTVG